MGMHLAPLQFFSSFDLFTIIVLVMGLSILWHFLGHLLYLIIEHHLDRLPYPLWAFIHCLLLGPLSWLPLFIELLESRDASRIDPKWQKINRRREPRL